MHTALLKKTDGNNDNNRGECFSKMAASGCTSTVNYTLNTNPQLKMALY